MKTFEIFSNPDTRVLKSNYEEWCTRNPQNIVTAGELKITVLPPAIQGGQLQFIFTIIVWYTAMEPMGGGSTTVFQGS